MKSWFTAQECVGLPGLPPDKRQIESYFRKDITPQYRRWIANKKQFECHLSGLPLVSQVALIKKYDLTRKLQQQQTLSYSDYDSEQLWSYVETATAKQLEKAQLKCQAVFAVEKLLSLGIAKMKTFELIGQIYGYKTSSIQYWYYKTRHYQPVDYLPVLLNKYNKPLI